MIDWWSVFTNSLWIVGLAAALAVLSYSDWLAFTNGKGLGSAARRLAHSTSFACSIALACVGAGLGVATWWERGLWLLVAAGFTALALRAWSSRRRDPQGE